MSYSHLKQKYGDLVETLENVQPIDYSKVGKEAQFDVELRNIDEPFYPFYYALILYRDDPITIEKCRLIHGHSLEYAFKETIYQPNEAYFEFLLDAFKFECFNSVKERMAHYEHVLKLLTRFRKPKLLKLVCDLLLENNELSMLNLKTTNTFSYIKGVTGEYRGTLIHEAIFNYSIQCLKILLEYGADANVVDSNNMYPWEVMFHIDPMEALNKLYYFLFIEKLILKNTINLPNNGILLEKFKMLIGEYLELKRHDDLTNKFIDEFYESIRLNEYHSLKHYARNALRLYRIHANGISSEKNNKVILEYEKSLFF